MGKTSIEWTDASWNPIVGCTEVSPGCANCYAARLAATRLSSVPAYKDLAILNRVHKEGKIHPMPRWLGNVRFLPERLKDPRHWRKPRRIFVCDMGDLFHEKVESEWIDRVFDTISDCPQHTFQILTKRADRMHAWFDREWRFLGEVAKPLPNVWLGVSVENQHFADERIPLLLQTPAAVRFISAEPLLGPVDLLRADPRAHALCGYYNSETKKDRPVGLLNWVIAGGESGPYARPMHPDWPRSLRDQCQAAGVPFFFKQWGAWIARPTFTAKQLDREIGFQRVGKKKAGRLLDGREWSEFPSQ